MKFKFHWGWAIVLVFIIFIGTIVFRIWLSNKGVMELVTSDYYPKEVEHQKHITKVQNATLLAEKISVITNSDSVIVSFPKLFDYQKLSGKINFYRPSDSQKDISFKIGANSKNLQLFSTRNLLVGKYIVQIEWQYNGIEYYQEQDIFVKH